ncbi:hypothetical protein I544_3886 [Mycobacteroides abscessus subsp. bolletii 103]|nr:hypothetical protein I544_3886 [Mycobacteroides abscessus subsp. bolletii 103]
MVAIGVHGERFFYASAPQNRIRLPSGSPISVPHWVQRTFAGRSPPIIHVRRLSL